jgi:hypothetical protein
MRSAIFRIVAVVTFCWAVFGLLSLLSELKILVDGLDWSISHASISYKEILLEIGRRISQAVSGYREIVRSLARLLHLPRLPSFVYDVIGIVMFSIGRGYWIGQRANQAYFVWFEREKSERYPLKKYLRKHPLLYASKRFKIYFLPTWFGRFRLSRFLGLLVSIWVVYGGVIAIVLVALFGVDYAYRHFT